MSNSNEQDLKLVRLFQAPRERVFDAWLDPASIAAWLGPRGITAEAMELNTAVGGRYRIQMRGEDGEGPIVGGIYCEIAWPDRLVFTWVWETDHPGGGAGRESLMNITFADAGGETEMTLEQEGFESPESRDSHARGWEDSFDRLAETLA